MAAIEPLETSDVPAEILIALLQDIELEATGLLLDNLNDTARLARLLDRLMRDLTRKVERGQSVVLSQLSSPETLRMFLRCQEDLCARTAEAIERFHDANRPFRQRLNEVLRMTERIRLDISTVDRTSRIPPPPSTARTCRPE